MSVGPLAGLCGSVYDCIAPLSFIYRMDGFHATNTYKNLKKKSPMYKFPVQNVYALSPHQHQHKSVSTLREHSCD